LCVGPTTRLLPRTTVVALAPFALRTRGARSPSRRTALHRSPTWRCRAQDGRTPRSGC